MFGTPRKDAGESEAKSPPPSKANGTETEGFPSPQAMMKEDMLKAMTPQEVGSQMVATKTSQLSKLGRKGIACSGKKDATMLWHHLLHNRVKANLGAVGVKIMSEKGYSEGDIQGLEEWKVAYVEGLNEYLYNMILESIDREEKWGEALLTSVLNEANNIDGRAGRLVDHIIRVGTHVTPEQAKVRLMEIDDMRISLSDSPEDMELTVQDMVKKWNSVPEQYRGHPHLLVEKLLNLYPTVCGADKKAMETNITLLQTMNMPMPTYAQIGQGIVTAVTKYKLSNASTLWAGGGGRDPPRGRREGDRREGDRKDKCANCHGEHKSYDCPKKCGGCDTAFCGSRGDASKCPCKQQKLLPREEITNMNKWRPRASHRHRR